MKIETQLSCGDKVWRFNGAHAEQLTVGQVRVEYTESRGCSDLEFRGDVIMNGGENYAPIRPQQEEIYMCTETGIGSGSLYKLGETIFLSKEDCLAANEAKMEANRLAMLATQAYNEEQELKAEGHLRNRLAKIESIKRKREEEQREQLRKEKLEHLQSQGYTEDDLEKSNPFNQWMNEK